MNYPVASACIYPTVAGLAIMSTVIIVVVVGSVNDWQKEKQFKALNEKKEDRTMKVIRDGAEKVVNVKVSSFFACPGIETNCFFFRTLSLVTSHSLSLARLSHVTACSSLATTSNAMRAQRLENLTQ